MVYSFAVGSEVNTLSLGIRERWELGGSGGYLTVTRHKYGITLAVIGPVVAHVPSPHSLAPVPYAGCRMCPQRVHALQVAD